MICGAVWIVFALFGLPLLWGAADPEGAIQRTVYMIGGVLSIVLGFVIERGCWRR